MWGSGKERVAVHTLGSRRSSASSPAFWKVPPGAPQPSSFVVEPRRVTRRKSRPSCRCHRPAVTWATARGSSGWGGLCGRALVGVGLSLGFWRSWNFLEPFLPLGRPESTEVSGGSGDCSGALQFRANSGFPNQCGGRSRPRGWGRLQNKTAGGYCVQNGNHRTKPCRTSTPLAPHLTLSASVTGLVR